MTYEQAKKMQDTPVSSIVRLQGLTKLLHAEAHLLAEHGNKAFIKEGPIKQAAQILEFARKGVLAAYVRERAAEIAGVSIEQLEAHLHQEAVAAVVEIEAAEAAARENFKMVPVQRAVTEPISDDGSCL